MQITNDELRRMTNQEGLILQGCGGDVQEWIDGINELLTQEGILLEGTKFKNVKSFRNEGLTNLLFPFEDVKLDLGKLAIWRIQSHETFGRAQIVNERRITIADVCLDYDSLTVSRGDESQTLPRKEFYLLYKLLSYPGKIFTRIQLMDEIWGMESQSDDNTINVHINRLRKRFEDYPEFAIETIRGLGYKAVKHL